MSTSQERSETNLYAYERINSLISKTTYRKNLVEEIQNDCGSKLNEFNADNMNDRSFREFVAKAEEIGYKIYRMIKL